jgi:hypothetical protein
MIFTSALVNQLRGDKTRKRDAREELWKAQAEDSFGVTASGGIYRPEIRSTSYRALIDAERTAREKAVFIPSIAVLDFDFDGAEEYLFQAENINCYISLRGGAVFEFDFLQRDFNYCDTLNSPRLFDDLLVHEGERRDCGLEWYLPFSVSKKAQNLRMGFKLESRKDSDREGSGIKALTIEKVYSLDKDRLEVSYRIGNNSSRDIEFDFIPRQAMSFPSDKPVYLRIYAIIDGAKTLIDSADYKYEGGISVLEAQDVKNEAILSLTSAKPFALRLERSSFLPPGCPAQKTPLYAASLAYPRFSLKLGPGEIWENGLVLRLAY